MKPELLSPIQDYTSLTAAIESGCDAVYFGIQELNMRMGAKNFDLKDLKKIISISHKNKVKAYLTLNTIIYNNEINKLKLILKKAKQAKVDAIICWDFSVINEANKLNLPIHISTQASISNFEAIKTLKQKFKNIKRVVLAREVTLEDIKKIIKKLKQEKINVGIEVFIHGAMCVSTSGRCFLSQELFNKSANRGECLQPCRRLYKLVDSEEGHEVVLGEDYILSPKDLCTIEFIDQLVKAGIQSFKIEGRNRSPEYVKTVTETYRKALDDLKTGKKQLLENLRSVYNRGFHTGFYLGKPIKQWSNSYGSQSTKEKKYLGIVKNYYSKVNVAEISLEANELKVGDVIMFQGPTTGVFEQKTSSIQQHHKNINLGKKGTRVGIKTIKKVRENDKVYLIR